MWRDRTLAKLLNEVVSFRLYDFIELFMCTSKHMFGGIVARCGGCAERTPADSDRADRLKPNIVFSDRGSYQRRGYLTVCKVASYRLTLPRTRQG